jgi:hypothetical protein
VESLEPSPDVESTRTVPSAFIYPAPSARWSTARAAVPTFPAPHSPSTRRRPTLDRVEERKGRIIVPEEPNHLIHGGYVLGNEQVEEFLLKHAHDRRIRFETEGRFVWRPRCGRAIPGSGRFPMNK